LALLDTASLSEIQQRLQPLTSKPESPYNALAREAVAMSKLRSGQFAAARSDFAIISLLPSAPDNVRQRAHAAMDLIDAGAPSGVGAIVKAGVALPPAPLTAQPPPGAEPAGDQGAGAGQ
jgi:hypothetical protein